MVLEWTFKYWNAKWCHTITGSTLAYNNLLWILRHLLNRTDSYTLGMGWTNTLRFPVACIIKDWQESNFIDWIAFCVDCRPLCLGLVSHTFHIPYSRKYWLVIKFDELAVCEQIAKLNSPIIFPVWKIWHHHVILCLELSIFWSLPRAFTNEPGGCNYGHVSLFQESPSLPCQGPFVGRRRSSSSEGRSEACNVTGGNIEEREREVQRVRLHGRRENEDMKICSREYI